MPIVSTFVTFTTFECGGCGVYYALTDDYVRRRREDHKGWVCPHGCHRAFNQDNDLETERKKTASLRARLDQAEADARFARRQTLNEQRSAAAYKGHLTRIRKRIANGVCPCCRRNFTQVRRHIKAKHPELVERWGQEVFDGAS